MNNSLQSHNCADELREQNLKATPARLAILKLFEQTDKPLDVAGIIANLKKKNIIADQATIFRVINAFTEKGLVKQLNLLEGKFRYELGSRPHHHHLVCNQCGVVEDIVINEANLIKKIQTKSKFLIERHHLEFFGLCHTCQISYEK